MIVGVSLFNPLIDGKLLKDMTGFARRYPNRIIPEGEVPGTGVKFAALREFVNAATKKYHTDSQRDFNSQLNLYRLKRVKIFNALLKRFPNLHTFSIRKLLNFCGSKKGTEFIITYGEDVPLEYFDQCPLCGCQESQPLHCDVSQPIIGFLTRHSRYYYLCHGCGLVYLNPHMPAGELWRYYDEYNFETPFKTENWADTLNYLNEENTSHLSNYQAIIPVLKKLKRNAKVLDLGGGIGEFCVFLKNMFPDHRVNMADIRLNSTLIDYLKERGIQAKQLNFVEKKWAGEDLDLITNWEVIEHIPLNQFENYLHNVYNSLGSKGFYIFSTPDFSDPLCRALDFWAMAPGEHLAVYSRKALEPLLTRCGFKIVEELHESVTLRQADRWFKYGAENNAYDSSRGESFIINEFLRHKELPNFRESFRKKRIGSELILITQKQ